MLPPNFEKMTTQKRRLFQRILRDTLSQKLLSSQLRIPEANSYSARVDLMLRQSHGRETGAGVWMLHAWQDYAPTRR